MYGPFIEAFLNDQPTLFLCLITSEFARREVIQRVVRALAPQARLRSGAKLIVDEREKAVGSVLVSVRDCADQDVYVDGLGMIWLHMGMVAR